MAEDFLQSICGVVGIENRRASTQESGDTTFTLQLEARLFQKAWLPVYSTSEKVFSTTSAAAWQAAINSSEASSGQTRVIKKEIPLSS
jgi:hypothetical protein